MTPRPTAASLVTGRDSSHAGGPYGGLQPIPSAAIVAALMMAPVGPKRDRPIRDRRIYVLYPVRS